MDVHDVLQECYLALSNVDYDLQRWEEELEQARWGSFLDQVIDIEMSHFDQAVGFSWDPIESVTLPRPEKDPDVLVLPLAYYEDDTRFVIGEADYNQRTGKITASVQAELLRGLDIDMAILRGDYNAYSIVPVQERMEAEYQPRKEPSFPRLQYDVGLEKFVSIVGYQGTRTKLGEEVQRKLERGEP